ncbi:MAG: dTDP-4-dehydrorhamnose reductase [Candidatus Rokubacteria bacterium]|nr:dTDP-4-dehydrorhamnose reductase [Candidatus Rokubacteria bacterium]
MILVTGAAGTVGSYFDAQRDLFPSGLELTDKVELDVCDDKAVMNAICGGRYTHVVHLAAETDVDLCERDPDHAFRVNAIGTENVALACRKTGAILVYVSTAGVFGGDGKLGPFTEYDPPCPANVYGHSKLAGERATARLLDEYYIVRAGWMMGGVTKDKKFVAKIMQQVAEGRPIRAVSDKIGSPTFAEDLVRGIAELIETGYYGLYHMTNQGVCSRYEIARHLVRHLGGRPDVIPVSSAHFPLPAPRANSEAMRNLKLQLRNIDRMSGWQDALDRYLDDWARRVPS